MNETSRQPPNDEVPPGDEPQPLRTEEQARIAKLVAEEALIREQLKRTQLENKAAARQAQSLSGKYSFVPTPKIVIQGIVAGILLLLTLFVLYQPLVDWSKLKAGKEATLAQINAEIQQAENRKLSQQLDEQEKQLNVARQEAQAQQESYTADLKMLAGRLKSTEENLNEAVQLAQKWETQLQERTAEYERLAQTYESEKAWFQQLARQEQARLKELAQQLAGLQTKARIAKEQRTQVQSEVETRPGRVFRDKLIEGSEGPEMIILATGNFLMGSSETEKGSRKSETPQHMVTISRPFALSINEITFAEYDTFAEATGRKQPNDSGWGRGNLPVISVSWEDATAYARWLSVQTKQHYRLPTEAEWEYAARAGSTTAYSSGNDPSRLGEYAWFGSNSGRKTHPVGKKKPNVWGLYDMYGNVWEWVEDDWHSDYNTAPNDGSAWKIETRSVYRVIRGGSWQVDARYCRSAYRSRQGSGYRIYFLGFRLARSVALGP